LIGALTALLTHVMIAIVITERWELVTTLVLGVCSGVVSLGAMGYFVTRQYPETIIPVVYLYGVGWLELLRLRPELAEKQSLWILVASAAAMATYQILQPISKLERYRIMILAGGLLLLFSALLVGTEVNGAKLWLRIGSVSFQPIEVVKILLVVTLASFWRRFRLWLRFSRDRVAGRLPRRGMLFLGLGWFLGLAILVVQRDLGMALLLIGVFFTMFYISTGRKDLVFVGVGAFFFASVLAILAFHHIRIRIRAWWDPFQFFDTDGYQLVQGLYAIADGGPWGRGLLLGRPHVIPEAHTDFILTAISHELGWLTALCVIYCVAFLGHRFFELASRCRGEFRRLLMTGLASLWSLQCFIIIAGTTKVIPMTGLTLPFVSYGGSSLLANAILFAMIVRCAPAGGGADG
jgi:cell division protein FtsW (lipid II flippase)